MQAEILYNLASDLHVAKRGLTSAAARALAQEEAHATAAARHLTKGRIAAHQASDVSSLEWRALRVSYTKATAQGATLAARLKAMETSLASVTPRVSELGRDLGDALGRQDLAGVVLAIATLSAYVQAQADDAARLRNRAAAAERRRESSPHPLPHKTPAYLKRALSGADADLQNSTPGAVYVPAVRTDSDLKRSMEVLKNQLVDETMEALRHRSSSSNNSTAPHRRSSSSASEPSTMS